MTKKETKVCAITSLLIFIVSAACYAFVSDFYPNLEKISDFCAILSIIFGMLTLGFGGSYIEGDYKDD